MGSNPIDEAAILKSLGNGDPDAASQLLPLVYDELRSAARALMRGESRAHTLQPTAVVHEAFMKLLNGTIDCKSRADFCGLAIWQMRRVLVDHARTRGRLKRGGNHGRARLEEGAAVAANGDAINLELHEALDKLAAIDERAARVADLRFFGGLSVKETATILGIAERTVEKDWQFASAWLKRQLAGDRSP